MTSGDEMSINAGYAYLYNETTGDVYFDQNADEKAYPASTTKVMTALLVCEAVERGELSYDQIITASSTFSEGLDPDGSTANIQAGEQMSVENLLYCMLLPSANEAANILAQAVSGSIEDFVALMNERAAELGCSGTHFTNPSGLHDDDHYTTAHDLCTIFCEALKHEEFLTIIGTAVYEVPATNLSDVRTLYNTNALISSMYYSGYVYDPCIGGKTGTTDEAGLCLVCAAEQDGTRLISVVLDAGVSVDENGDTVQEQFTESARLLDWGFENFTRALLLEGGVPITEAKVELSSKTDHVLLCPESDIEVTVLKSLDTSTLTTQITLSADSFDAPIEKGQVLGTVSMVDESGKSYGSTNLIAMQDVSRSGYLYALRLLHNFFSNPIVQVILVILAFVIAVSILYFGFIRRGKRTSVNSYQYRGKRRREEDHIEDDEDDEDI